MALANSSSVRLYPHTSQLSPLYDCDEDMSLAFQTAMDSMKYLLIRRVHPLVSGGFAIVQPGSKLSINAVEGFPLEDFSADVSLF